MTVRELIEKLNNPEWLDYPVVTWSHEEHIDVEICSVVFFHGDYETDTGRTKKGKWAISLDT